MKMPEDFSAFVRAEELRRADAARIAAEIQEKERQARTQADAARLAEDQTQTRRAELLQADASRVAAAAKDNIQRDAIIGKGFRARNVGWLLEVLTDSTSQELSSLSTRTDHFVRATILSSRGKLQVTGVAPIKSSEVHDKDRLRRRLQSVDGVTDITKVSETEFTNYRVLLRKFVLDKSLNIQ